MRTVQNVFFFFEIHHKLFCPRDVTTDCPKLEIRENPLLISDVHKRIKSFEVQKISSKDYFGDGGMAGYFPCIILIHASFN